IGDSMSRIHQLVIDVVGNLAKVVAIDEWSWMQASDAHIQFEELYSLFCLGLGLKTEERLDIAFRRLNAEAKNLRVYLRMLIAVAVYKNVFTPIFPDFPIPSRRWAMQAFQF